MNMRSIGILFLAATGLAHGAFTYSGTPSTQWAIDDVTLGFTCPVIESFEAAQLVPGLSVSWIAGAGTIGPVTTLPKIFQPQVEDNLFSPGVWDGNYNLISGYGNLSQPYNDATKWGNVEFAIAGGTTQIGFSLQQMNLNNQLVVNGVNVGGISTITGGAINTSGQRNGFLKITATGGDKINTVRIVNLSGDGFTIDHLIFNGSPSANANLKNPAFWGVNAANLNMQFAEHEDFEDVNLEPGLSVKLESTNGNYGPSNTLPGLFDPFADAFGTAFRNGQWTGKHGLVNTRTNNTFTYSQKDNWGDITLLFASGATKVGFSLQQLDMYPTIYVNDQKLGTLPWVPCGNIASLTLLGARNGYLTLETLGAPITSVRIANGRLTFNDGFMIDYLSYLPAGIRFGGNIGLEDWAKMKGVPMTFEFRRASDNVLVATVNETVSSLGDFGFAKPVPNGNYKLRVDGRTFLPREIEVTIGDNTYANISMLNGDCDGDDYVGTDDYLILNGAFDTSEGDAGFDARADLDGEGTVGTDDYLILNKAFDTAAGDETFDARADLNGDGTVGTDDYLILNKNFDLSGDE